MGRLNLVNSEIVDRGQGEGQNVLGSLPKISIVTPSYNQGQFIEETIESVVSQSYPNIEYIIIDGGSTDNTLEVIARHQDKMYYWVSERDEGAADAIEKGRRICTGELFNWLNSDDYLLPGTLLSLGTIATKFPQFDIYAFIGVGAGVKGPLMTYFGLWPDQTFSLLSCRNPFGQESTFVRTRFLIDNQVTVSREFCNAFDTVFFEELLAKGARVLFINAFGGVIRHHDDAKTAIGTPELDRLLIKQWEGKLFNRPQRLWRRLNITRFHRMQRCICGVSIVREMIRILLKLPQRDFVTCKFIGNRCDLPASWVID